MKWGMNMKFYMIADKGFGTDIHAERYIFVYKDDLEIPEIIRKFGEEITEAQYRAIFREMYHVNPDYFLNNLSV